MLSDRLSASQCNAMIKQARSICENNGKNAYKVAAIVSELANSRAFVFEVCGGHLDKVDEQLADLSEQFGLSVLDMQNMFTFLSESEWSSGRLAKLRDIAVKRLNENVAGSRKNNQVQNCAAKDVDVRKHTRSKPGSGSIPTAGDDHPATAIAEKQSCDIEELQSRIRELETLLQVANDSNRAYAAKIEQLRSQDAAKDGRIKQLERTIELKDERIKELEADGQFTAPQKKFRDKTAPDHRRRKSIAAASR